LLQFSSEGAKMTHSPSITRGASALVGLAVLVGVALAADRGLPAQHGIKNFGKVNEHLYRGAQLDTIGVKNLATLGVKTIINLRPLDKEWATEESDARAAGITFTNVPFKGLGRPTDGQVAKVLSLIDNSPGPVFVHCEYGCDRTGTIVACYRIRHDHWSADAAQKEADTYGMSRLERGMRSFVANFAKMEGKKLSEGPDH
jgi:uncharacterized protein (TIGR01244 family)